MKNQTPRRKRMKRQSRLQSAQHWIRTYEGKDLIKGYRKWFGVDLLCTVTELKILGIKLDEQHVAQILKNDMQRIAAKKRYAEKSALENQDNLKENTYLIGYTHGGFPYGLPWEDIEELYPFF
jgi:hypothetical protein